MVIQLKALLCMVFTSLECLVLMLLGDSTDRSHNRPADAGVPHSSAETPGHDAPEVAE